MSGETFLSIQPAELKFQFELNRQSSCTMQLANKTEDYIAFKVKTTNPKKYSVRPNTGIVLPGSTYNVLVTMQAQREFPPDMQCKDKFLVQSVVAAKGATTKDITPEMFNKEPNKVIDEFKTWVVYVRSSPPSSVPEVVEEGSSPMSSMLENGVQHSSSTKSRSNEPIKENPSQASSIISKLTEEKATAVQQNQKLRQGLEMLRRESSKHQGGFSVAYVALIALISFFIGFFIKKT